MKLFVIGGSGRTGKFLLDEALGAGHEVTAVARNPASIEKKHERLTVVPGDVRKPETLAVRGHDAAIVILNPPSMRGVVDTFTVGATNVCKAMQDQGVRRLLFVTSGAVIDDPGLAFVFRWVIKPLLMSKIYADAGRAEDVVRATGLDWVLVRPPRLTDGPRTGVYRVSPNLLPPGGSTLSRADLAHFLVAEAAEGKYTRGTPTLAY